MPDTITPRIKPPNYTDREISDRLEKAGELRKHIKPKERYDDWIVEILKKYLPVKNDAE